MQSPEGGEGASWVDLWRQSLQVEGTGYAKGLSQECSWLFGGTARKPMWLTGRELRLEGR